MKVIALMPTKNEAWILPTTLPPLTRFVDDIILLDAQSTDRTRHIAESFGAHVVEQEQGPVNFAHWRQTLLDLGRQRGGTHFVWLDADEGFTSHFLGTYKRRLAEMHPGQKLVLDWICLWKDASRIRSDHSIWAINPKDFVFCDDLISDFSRAHTLHEARTPRSHQRRSFVRIPREEGAVLHFQCVPFKRFLMKQAYLRCQEWDMTAMAASTINKKYYIARDPGEVRCLPTPANWLEGFNGLDALKSQEMAWFCDELYRLFAAKGIQHYEPLDLWHIPELHQAFVKQVGREPHIACAPLAWRLKESVKDALRPWLRQYALPRHL